MIRPQVTKLYKYREYGERPLSMLEKDQVFLAAPSSFNDPFDCAIQPIIDIDANGDDLIELTAAMFEHFGIDKKETRRRLAAFSGAKADHVDAICQMFKAHVHSSNYHDLGVLSLSEINDCPLMWAHYGGKHTGFCIEYQRTETNDLADAKPVTYAEKYPEVGLFRMAPYTQAELSVLTKDACWRYEKEWRRVISEPNSIKVHHPSMISGVIFGARMKHNHKLWMRARLKSKPHVKFYQAKLKDRAYGIEIVPVN